MNFFFFNLMEDWRQFWKRLSGSGRSKGETTRLYVGNLSYNAKEEDLKSLFAGCGRVSDVHLIRDRFTRRPKGYAFVEIAKDDTAKALNLSGSDFMGRKLVVSEAKSRGPAAGGGSGQPRRQRQEQHQQRDQHSQRSGAGQSRSGGRRRPMKGPRAYKPSGSPQASSKDETQIERLE